MANEKFVSLSTLTARQVKVARRIAELESQLAVAVAERGLLEALVKTAVAPDAGGDAEAGEVATASHEGGRGKGLSRRIADVVNQHPGLTLDELMDKLTDLGSGTTTGRRKLVNLLGNLVREGRINKSVTGAYHTHTPSYEIDPNDPT